MRAAVLTGAGELDVVDDWPEPTAGHGEVVVAVDAVALCGTDLGYYTGKRELWAERIVLGHEVLATIEAVGDGVDPSRIGERVAIEPNYPCGACQACRTGHPALCQARRSPVINEHGFLAERVAVPADYAWTLPESVSDEDAVCIEPLAVVLAAVRRAGAIEPGAHRVGITGAGAIGRILTDALVRRGVVPAVADLQPARVAAAVALGGRPMADGETFDVIFETTGSGRAATAAVERLAAAGRLVTIGLGEDPLVVDTRLLVRRGLQLRGSMIYDHPVDFHAVIGQVEAGFARPGAVLGEPYPLSESVAAFRAAPTAADKVWIRVRDAR